MRVVNLVLLALMLVGAVVTYQMKYRAEVAAGEVARLNRDIGEEKEAIRLLNAELSLLTQPARVQAVVAEHDDYFALRAFSPDQVAGVDDIPPRTAVSPSAAAAAAPGGTSAAVNATLARIAAGGALRGDNH
jgi:hypothetical protein